VGQPLPLHRRASGKELWVLKLGKPEKLDWFLALRAGDRVAAVGDGKVFISTNDGILHALEIESGKEVWRIDWKNMGYSSPLYRDGRVYCALSDKGKVFCVDADTGQFIWQTDTGSVIYDSSFCFGGGNVFIGCVMEPSPRSAPMTARSPGNTASAPATCSPPPRRRQTRLHQLDERASHGAAAARRASQVNRSPAAPSTPEA
jgi:hypothetical protein